MKKKQIEKISILCAFGALIITLGAIPLGSYLGYRNFLKCKSLFGLDFVFDEIPNKLIPFDNTLKIKFVC